MYKCMKFQSSERFCVLITIFFFTESTIKIHQIQIQREQTTKSRLDKNLHNVFILFYNREWVSFFFFFNEINAVFLNEKNVELLKFFHYNWLILHSSHKNQLINELYIFFIIIITLLAYVPIIFASLTMPVRDGNDS